MRIRFADRVRRLGGWLRSYRPAVGVILLYHRVEEAPSDVWSLSVTPGHFAEHVDVLAAHGGTVRLDELVRSLHDETPPRHRVAVTFDDGYADNLHQAKPLLEQRGIPATVFVTTGNISRNLPFWWDQLESVFIRTDPLPGKLELPFDGKRRSWDLQGIASRSRVLHEVHRMLLSSDDRRRTETLDLILGWAGDGPGRASTARVLRPDELVRLAEGPLIDIGSHTVTHPVLSAHSAAVQRQELRESKEYLEGLLHRPVSSFAYPFGSSRDYTSETMSLLRDCGYEHACTAASGAVWPRTSAYELPRILVTDCDGRTFGNALRWLAPAGP